MSGTLTVEWMIQGLLAGVGKRFAAPRRLFDLLVSTNPANLALFEGVATTSTVARLFGNNIFAIFVQRERLEAHMRCLIFTYFTSFISGVLREMRSFLLVT